MMRNWKWFVPLLCLVVVVCVVGFTTFILTLLKSSGAYSGALTRVKSNPAVIAALGSPIKDGFFFSGNISETGSSGSANFVIPINGPNGAAQLYVSASRSHNGWHYDKLIVKIKATKQQVDISDAGQLPNK
jgi:Cytochrome oxidase complex assembly protein 1